MCTWAIRPGTSTRMCMAQRWSMEPGFITIPGGAGIIILVPIPGDSLSTTIPGTAGAWVMDTAMAGLMLAGVRAAGAGGPADGGARRCTVLRTIATADMATMGMDTTTADMPVMDTA